MESCLYIVRHCESVANLRDLLAGQTDCPLSEQGLADAAQIAERFAERFTIDRILSSPLLRARQTATAFATRLSLAVATDERIMEQHLGCFSGMSYHQLETEPGYEHDRTRRWDWVPEGGGESYRMVAARVKSFFATCPELRQGGGCLVVTHAVTMRLIRMVLEQTEPRYPEAIARNGEIWRIRFDDAKLPCPIESIQLLETAAHRA